MFMTPSSFTYEHLKNLKFKELQKLSVQFHVNKRWAKKQELIDNLLALKEKNEATINNKQEDELEWRDASTVFSDFKSCNENADNKRLTYNIPTKFNAEHNDSHLTFEVPQNGKNLLCETVSSRETYDIPPSRSHFLCEPLEDSRATFEIPPKKKLMDETYSRSKFFDCKDKDELLGGSTTKLPKNLGEENTRKKNLRKMKINPNGVDGSVFEQNLGKIKFDINLKHEKLDKDEKKKSEMKLLTIPCARVTRRVRAGEAFRNDNLPIKMSKKSINIKKSTRLPVSKADLIKSPAFSSVKKLINKQTVIQSLTKNPNSKPFQSKVPVRLKFTEEKVKPKDDDKENAKNIVRNRISKSADETVNNKPNSGIVNLKTPTSSFTKNSNIVALRKTTLRKDADARFNSNAIQTPGNKPSTKPITTTKMPDFSKIHKKQFEQMDSLHDYLKKKEDRIRKLFGVPQPGQQLHDNLNKSVPVFHFQSTATDKDKEKESLMCTRTPVKKKEFTQIEACKNKLPPAKLRTDIKDKNRSHIHGVRTNKRFELQMKFRNM